MANVELGRDPRFETLCRALHTASPIERERMTDYIASRFAESRRVAQPLPPLGADVLTFARTQQLFAELVRLQTEGHVQQFLVAALLTVHRTRYGFTVRTHHPHAADKFDQVAGDIEEFRDETTLIRAYEVTVRPDWKNRVSNFRDKMVAHGLSKYVIIAQGVNADDELAEPARLITFLEPYGKDIAVVDIRDFTTVMAAELSAREIREAVNLTFGMLCDLSLSGRADFQDRFRSIVDQWLDEPLPSGPNGT